MTRVLVTGSAGFIGTHLCPALSSAGFDVRAVVRSDPGRPLADRAEVVEVGEITRETEWSEHLRGIDCVIHLAARVHVMRETKRDPLEAYREINVQASQNLARSFAEAGGKRLIFLSSIKVNGESTSGCAFSVSDAPAPRDAYGRSKLEAELALRQLASSTGLEVTVVRPPLVYGPGVGGNFRRLMQAVERGYPLPFGGIRNHRSLMSVYNLTDLLVRCIDHPCAANATFLVSDGQDLSTPELLRRLAAAMNKRLRMFTVPQPLLWAGAFVTGRRDFFQRLCGSLQIDLEHTRSTLGWNPPMSVDEALRKSV